MALELYPIEKELAKERQEAQDFGRGVDNLPKNLDKLEKGTAVDKAAYIAGISGETLRQYKNIQEKGSEGKIFFQKITKSN